MSALFDQLRQAIRDRHQVHAVFAGCWRAMCPHVLGYMDGVEACLFYQFAGGSASGLGPLGSPHNWRCIKLDGLEQVIIKPGTFCTAANYDAVRQRCIDTIIEEVQLLHTEPEASAP